MTQEELTKYADVLERIQGMSETDIVDMPYEYTIRLIDNFNSELLIRELVARGHNKDWQKTITTRLKNFYEGWFMSKDPWYREEFHKKGRSKEIRGWLESINYDVYSHRLITSEYAAAMQAIDEEETDDEEQEDLREHPEDSWMQEAEGDESEEDKQDEKVLYNKVSFEFFLRLLEQAGFDINNTGNKTRADDLWHMMTGKSADEIRRFSSKRAYYNNHTKEDVKRLNNLLSQMGITSITLQ